MTNKHILSISLQKEAIRLTAMALCSEARAFTQQCSYSIPTRKSKETSFEGSLSTGHHK